MTTALYPGSFDPVHLGHLAVIEQVARAFDDVVVAVLGNPQKGAGLFAIAERVRLVEAVTAHLPSVRCVAFDGLTVDLVREERAAVVVRSAHKESGQERSMAFMNEAMAGIPTCFAAPDPATRHISSKLVRDLTASGQHEQAARLVPAAVRTALDERRARGQRP